MARRAVSRTGVPMPDLVRGLREWNRRKAEAFPGIASAVGDALDAGEPILLTRRTCFRGLWQIDPHLAAQMFSRDTGAESDLFLLTGSGELTLVGDDTE